VPSFVGLSECRGPTLYSVYSGGALSHVSDSESRVSPCLRALTSHLTALAGGSGHVIVNDSVRLSDSNRAKDKTKE
jgi:hypothetical protein